MELRNIYSFLKVVEKNSFSKAAEELGYNQSSVTMQIKSLEAEFNTKLFDRIGKKIYLTQKGEEFYSYCLTITRVVNETTDAMSHIEKMDGILRIGCIKSIESSFMRDLVIKYHKMFPLVEIHLRTGTSTKLLSLLKNDQVDLIFTLDHALYSNDWFKYSNKKEPIVFVGSCKNKFSCLNFNNISNYSLLLTEKGESYRYILENMLAENNITISPIVETGNTDSIKHYILNQLGIGFLPHYTIENELKENKLQILETSFEPLTMWLQVFYHKNKTITKPILEFLKLYDQWNSNR